jgi:WD40 repeat protein
MRGTPIAAFAIPVTLALLVACETEPHPAAPRLQAMSFANSEWSAPVNLGAPINTPFLEASPTLSKDGLRLYFVSNRPGGFGLQDLWASQRSCAESVCPWQEPVNLGPAINSARVDNGPNLSADEHLLFYFSDRPGGHGKTDIWMSRRADPKDDLGWEEPVDLGSDVNSADFDQKPWYQQNAEEGGGNLYFTRGDPAANAQDIYFASVTRDGETSGPTVFVAELNVPNFSDAGTTLRADGREIFFSSNRPGTLGLGDLWTSTRRSVHDPWGTPVNLGAPLNTAAQEQQPSLSHDGRTLIWASTRPGGVGGLDIWMSTRTPSGH